LPVISRDAFAGKTFVLRIDREILTQTTTLGEDLGFLIERGIRPIVVAPTSDVARGYVRALNRHTNIAVGLSGADAGLLPASGNETIGRVQTGILATLLSAGYVPVIEPTALGIGGNDVELAADDVAAAIGGATSAARAFFFHEAGGVFDPQTLDVIAELTPAEALALAERDDLDPQLRAAVRAAARGVRAGVNAAQILDGRIAHATIVEFLTSRHLGTQVTGAIYTGGVA
jgi:acetylglutamate kinase